MGQESNSLARHNTFKQLPPYPSQHHRRHCRPTTSTSRSPVVSLGFHPFPGIRRCCSSHSTCMVESEKAEWELRPSTLPSGKKDPLHATMGDHEREQGWLGLPPPPSGNKAPHSSLSRVVSGSLLESQQIIQLENGHKNMKGHFTEEKIWMASECEIMFNITSY